MDYSFLMFLGFLSITANHVNTTESIKFRIVNGTQVTNRSQFPYQAAIINKKNNYFFCGGAIIHKKFVLTAAHCFYDSYDFYDQVPSETCVEVGNIKLFNLEEMNILCKDVQSIIIHEKYKETILREYDIALLEISGGFGNWTNAVNLIYINKHPTFDENCIVSGFGRTGYRKQDPPLRLLRYAEVSVLDWYKCSKAYSRKIPMAIICGRGHSSFCSGDSGGPLVCSDQLVGVVSGAMNCSAEKSPNLYVKVSVFLDWIKLHIDGFDTTDEDLAPTRSSPPSSAERRIFSLFFLLIAIVPLLKIIKDMFA